MKIEIEDGDVQAEVAQALLTRVYVLERESVGEDVLPELKDLVREIVQAHEDYNGEDIEFDPIAICCEWAESSVKELLDDYRHIFDEDFIELETGKDTGDFGSVEGLREHAAENIDIDEFVDKLNDETMVAGVTINDTVVYHQL